eukprot:tig00000912_g5445.t1
MFVGSASVARPQSSGLVAFGSPATPLRLAPPAAPAKHSERRWNSSRVRIRRAFVGDAPPPGVAIASLSDASDFAPDLLSRGLKRKECEACSGTGKLVCKACGGAGRLAVPSLRGSEEETGIPPIQVVCGDCLGFVGVCGECYGTGMVDDPGDA